MLASNRNPQLHQYVNQVTFRNMLSNKMFWLLSTGEKYIFFLISKHQLELLEKNVHIMQA